MLVYTQDTGTPKPHFLSSLCVLLQKDPLPRQICSTPSPVPLTSRLTPLTATRSRCLSFILIRSLLLWTVVALETQMTCWLLKATSPVCLNPGAVPPRRVVLRIRLEQVRVVTRNPPLTGAVQYLEWVNMVVLKLISTFFKPVLTLAVVGQLPS